MSRTSSSNNKVALILGVANQRSIAWACVQSFLEAKYECIITYQSERFQSQITKLLSTVKATTTSSSNVDQPRITALKCNVQYDLPQLFEQQIPSVLLASGDRDNSCQRRKIDAVVHSVAYADLERGKSLAEASWEAYAQAQHISSYSLLELANCAYPHMSQHNSSITALSYLGAIRAVPNYHIMGPAKASLEALVRALAIEYGSGVGTMMMSGRTPLLPEEEGSSNDASTVDRPIIRFNAVSAAPLNTMSAKGIPGFSKLYEKAAQQSPLGRHVTAKEVADTIRFLATDGTGINGQTIYVDGGFSSVVGL